MILGKDAHLLSSQFRHGNTIPSLASVTGAALDDIRGVFQILPKRRLQLAGPVPMNDAEERCTGQGRAVKCSNNLIQRFICRFPSHIYNGLFISIGQV